jgi:glutamyl-tRNA synthetase
MVLNQPARVRFAPSPTGHTHLGSGRTALYDYLLARQTYGQFVLRIEDTDQKRYVHGAEEELMKSLRWLGLEWDEGPDVGGSYGPYRQSARKEIYQYYARKLIESGHAYYCFCTPERLDRVRKEQMANKLNPRYDKTCRNIDPDEADKRVAQGERFVIRFKIPTGGSITVRDLLRGDISVDNTALDDAIIIKSDGLALYHLASMIDDHLMEITHVIRGAEWLPTYPLHAHIIRAFGWEEPIFIHLSVFLKPSGKGKMSKRESADLVKDGYSIFIKDMQELGYLPEAVVNWIALMGWSYDDRTEFFTLDDLVKKFSLASLNPAPAAINFSKLDHFNGLYIRNLDQERLVAEVNPFLTKAGYHVDNNKLLKMIPIIRERLVTLDDIVPFGGFFFQDDIEPVAEELIGNKMTASESEIVARSVLEIFISLPASDLHLAEEKLRNLATAMGYSVGQVFGIIRVAVTGQKVSPPLFESMEIIGKQVVITRMQKAIDILEDMT